MKKFFMFMALSLTSFCLYSQQTSVSLKNNTLFTFDVAVNQTSGAAFEPDTEKSFTHGWPVENNTLRIDHPPQSDGACGKNYTPLWQSYVKKILPGQSFAFQGRITYDKDHFIGINQLLTGDAKTEGGFFADVSVGGQPLSGVIPDIRLTREKKTKSTYWHLPDPEDPANKIKILVQVDAEVDFRGRKVIGVSLSHA